jgi:hypothetical protein
MNVNLLLQQTPSHDVLYRDDLKKLVGNSLQLFGTFNSIFILFICILVIIIAGAVPRNDKQEFKNVINKKIYNGPKIVPNKMHFIAN